MTQKPTKMAQGGQVQTEVDDTRRVVQDELQRTPVIVRVEDITTGITDRDNTLNAGVI